MFTGIVEDVGEVAEIAALPSEGARRIVIRASLLEEEQAPGASLAVAGVCLTVTRWRRGEVEAIIGPETLACTTLGALAPGARVHLERPLRLGDRLGGHLVAGHVDGVGRIGRLAMRAEAVDLTIELEPRLLRYLIAKGSVGVDGVSLTVNSVDMHGFVVSLIPHTQEATTLADKRVGAEVNIEVDLIGKYIEKLVAGARP